MKFILTSFFSIIVLTVFSGDLNKQILECSNPPDSISISNKVVVLINSNTGMDQQAIERCINGLEITLNLRSQAKIADRILIENKPDAKVINELDKKYSLKGLLFLSNIIMQRTAKDVPGDKIEYIDNRMPEPYFQVEERILPWTILYVEITSKWVYYDLNSGKQLKFKVKNNKAFEFREYVSDIDSLVDVNRTNLQPLFYENGMIMAEKLLKTIE